MSNNEHPITPPPELVEQWALAAIARFPDDEPGDLLSIEEARDEYVATQAARWGYEQRGAVNEAEPQQARDEEFEACCKAFEDIWDQEDLATIDDCLRGLRAVLARWGNTTPQPVSAEGDVTDDQIEAEFRSWFKDTYGDRYYGAIPLAVLIPWTRHKLALDRSRRAPVEPADYPCFVLRLDGSDPAAMSAMRAYAEDPACPPELAGDLAVYCAIPAQVPPAGEVAELARWLRELGAKQGGVFDVSTFCANLDRAAELLERQQPQPDFRALCAELVDELHAYKVGHPRNDTDLIDRACAALDQPVPPRQKPLNTDMDANRWASEFVSLHGGEHELMRAWFANALMCGWDNHYWTTPEYKASINSALRG